MFFHHINDEDFIQVLGALPSSPAVTRAYLPGAFGVIVTEDDPRVWWNALKMDRGEGGCSMCEPWV